MESHGKDNVIEKLNARTVHLAMLKPVKRVLEGDLAKLARREPVASEVNVIQDYHTLTGSRRFPGGQHSPESYTISHAKRVLDEDYYGLKKWLVHRVGKTSIGKLIARTIEPSSSDSRVGGLINARCRDQGPSD